MSLVETIRHDGGIHELRLARAPVNALNPALVAELDAALDRAFQDGSRALVISGREGLFSAGLDVPELLSLDEQGMRAFWQSLFGVLERLASSPIPIVAALTGHSPAGGTVIALFCDYRVQANGEFRLGLNEVQVGLVVPPVIQRALARLIGAYPAERHLVAGDMISVDAALKVGLVDELEESGRVVERALAWCRGLLALPSHSMLATRQLCRRDLAALFDDRRALDIDAFVAGWFEEQTQATLKALVKRLQSGN